VSEAKPFGCVVINRTLSTGLGVSHDANPSFSLTGACWACDRRLGNGSRMSREVQVRFCESVGVGFPRATHRAPRTQAGAVACGAA